jgi:expansin (peptidoglycan-binding protein)
MAYLRGKDVSVCYGASCVVVRVIDCDCQAINAIDLYSDAFMVLAPLSRGRIPVTIRW